MMRIVRGYYSHGTHGLAKEKRKTTKKYRISFGIICYPLLVPLVFDVQLSIQ